MVRFAHIADTHIRNLKYHEEYSAVFEKMYESLRENNVDYIVHCGDIAHTKTQISPEFVEMAAKFFRGLSDIAPTYIILGNHDGNLKNENRQDAITPIIDALGAENLHLLKGAGETDIGNGVVLNVLSVFDEENWIKPTDESKINIALYHGSVSGVVTDTGWVMEHGEHDVSIFSDFDYAFLGDIHKTNQSLDPEGRVRYPGSTIQQNHGETNDKGFLLWDIESKDNFSCKHIAIENPRPFVTVELTKKGRIPKGTKIPEGSRLRVVCNHSLPLHKLRRAMDIAKTKFKPTSVTFLNKAIDETGVNIDGNFVQEDLRDPAVQEKLIKEYLQDYEVSDDILDRVYSLNKRYNSIVEETEAVRRNIRFKLKSLEWNNLFNYGTKNKIDFDNVNGIVGIFGKNFSGKSSIIDSLLYTLYNSTSKGNRKNLNSINQSRDWGSGKATIQIGDNTLTVERKSEKYTKTLKGETTEEAKTDVNFWAHNAVTGEMESLNGLDRNGTDKNIRKFFGTLDDFLLTSMASQLGSLAFIGEGSTKRKEILAKFLDLEIFEHKYKLAKDDAVEMRAVLKRLESIDFDTEILSAKERIKEQAEEIQQQMTSCTEFKTQLRNLEAETKELQRSIDNIPADIIDIDFVESQLKEAERMLQEVNGENRELGKAAKKNRLLVEKIGEFVGGFNIDEWVRKQEVIDEKREALAQYESEISTEESKLRRQEKKIKMLEDHEYDPDCEYCSENQFVKDAMAALQLVGGTRTTIASLLEKSSSLESEIESMNPALVDDYIEKHAQVMDKKATAESDISAQELEIARNKTKALKIKSNIKEYKSSISIYESNREAIENLEQLNARIKDAAVKKSEFENSLADCETRLSVLYKESGSTEQRLSDLEAQKLELAEASEEYAAYDLFMKCVHTNGVALDIIKNKLPVINTEIASVLANIVDFQVYLQDDDKKLEIFIKHPKFEPRPLEMGSGAEKTIAAMAIRLALLNVSSLPKGDLFILDEPGTALDEENMEGFIRILDIVKTHFKTVLLISHLDSMKDCVDSQISIEKKRGFAYVNQ